MNYNKVPIPVILQGRRFTGGIFPLSPRGLNKSRFCTKPAKEDQNIVLHFSLITGFSLTRKCASETHCLAEKWKRDAKRQGERVLSDAHGLGW